MFLRNVGWLLADYTALSGSGQGPMEGSFEHGNEPSGSIKCCEILE
jgi:hypothetical protein